MSNEHPASEPPRAAAPSLSGLGMLLWSVALLGAPALGVTALKWLLGW